MRMPVIMAWLVMSMAAQAADTLVVRDAMIPEKPPAVTIMGAFMTIENPTAKEVKVTAVSSPAFKSAEMHQTILQDNVAKMVKQSGLTIPAKGKLELKRGSYHLMLFNPKQLLKAGDTVAIVFTLQGGATQTVTATVKPATLDDAHEHHHHH